MNLFFRSFSLQDQRVRTERFHKFVLIPQLFSIAGIEVLATSAEVSSTSMVQLLVVLTYIMGVMVTVRSGIPQVSLRVHGMYHLGLFVILLLGCFVARADVVWGGYLPSAACLVVAARSDMPLPFRFLQAGGVAVCTVLLMGLGILVGAPDAAWWCALGILVAAAVLVPIWRREAVDVRSRRDDAPIVPEAGPDFQMLPESEGRKAIMVTAQQVMTRRLSDLERSYLVTVLVVEAGVLAVVLGSLPTVTPAATLVLCGLLLQWASVAKWASPLLPPWRGSHTLEAEGVRLGFFAGGVMVMLTGISQSPIPLLNALTAGGVTAALVGAAPVPHRFAHRWAGLLVLLTAAWGWSHVERTAVLLLVAAAVPTGVVLQAWGRRVCEVERTRAALSILERYATAQLPADQFAELLTWLLRGQWSAVAGVLAWGAEKGVVIAEDGSARDPGHDRHLRTLLTHEVLSDDDEVVPIARLGEAFHGPFREWFGYVPELIFVSRLRVREIGGGERIVIIVPARGREWEAIRSQARDLCASARVYLRATETHSSSSEVLLSAQELLVKRDEELNDLIHLVNNVAQELTTQSTEPGNDGAAFGRLVRQQVACLSLGASDVRLRRELLLWRKGSRSEMAVAADLFESLKLWASYRAYRRGFSLTQEGAIGREAVVKVPNADLTGVALRVTIDEHLKSLQPHDRCALFVFEREDQVEMLIKITTRAARDGDVAVRSDDPTTEAARRFLESAGIGMASERGPSGDTISLKLSRGVVAKSSSSVTGGWILFIDDSPGMIALYTRIAGALGVPHVAVMSVKAAREAVKERGCPRLIVSDLQLPDGKGDECIEEVRGTFSRAVPTLIVSGEIPNNARLAQDAIMTRYLVKPVSRSKLFAEIEQMLES